MSSFFSSSELSSEPCETFVRADKALVALGLTGSRNLAQEMIRAGLVSYRRSMGWSLLKKASEAVKASVGPNDFLLNAAEKIQYVSRGGRKLEGALTHLNMSVTDKIALDIGQSTGGFTDCLLKKGALKVVGIDVGQGQLADSLRHHPSVVFFEKMHVNNFAIHHLKEAIGQGVVDLAVIDVSFISLTKVLPKAALCVAQGGWILALVKPQFELGPKALTKKGIVRADHVDEVEKLKQILRAQCESLELQMKDFFSCDVLGGDGNQEYFLFAQKCIAQEC